MTCALETAAIVVVAGPKVHPPQAGNFLGGQPQVISLGFPSKNLPAFNPLTLQLEASRRRITPDMVIVLTLSIAITTLEGDDPSSKQVFQNSDYLHRGGERKWGRWGVGKRRLCYFCSLTFQRAWRHAWDLFLLARFDN